VSRFFRCEARRQVGVEKRSILKSYVAGITDDIAGERYTTIVGYFLPELVTAFLVGSVLGIIDAGFVAHLKSTTLYTTQGITASFIHFLSKLAEGVSVGTVVLCGQYNGLRRFEDVGRAAVSAFWVTFCMGGMISLFLYFGGHLIYDFCQVPEKIARAGIPFLQIRALGVFLTFLYFAVIGFLRGVKNTRLPMVFFVLGGLVFTFFDYALIFGHFGFPEMGLCGSAVASVLQYAVMLCAAVAYVLLNGTMRQYSLRVFKSLDRGAVKDIIRLSWPVMVDKAILAMAKLWIVRLIAPLGKVALASFAVVRDMEQFAFVPAIAFAQVITFLVSNDYGIKNWLGIKTNIKKVLFLAGAMVSAVLLVFSIWPEYVIHLFDPKNKFLWFAATVFPMISILVLFDLTQVILSGALRGASNVRVVMFTRLLVCGLVFIPLSYFFSILPIENALIKFVLIYGSFYLADGVMSIVYVFWFRRDRWKYDPDISYSRINDGTHN